MTPPIHPLTDAQLEDALRQFFDADRLPEIALVPLTLLAEIARRVKEQKEADQPPMTAFPHHASAEAWWRRRQLAREEAEQHTTGP